MCVVSHKQHVALIYGTNGTKVVGLEDQMNCRITQNVLGKLARRFVPFFLPAQVAQIEKDDKYKESQFAHLTQSDKTFIPLAENFLSVNSKEKEQILSGLKGKLAVKFDKDDPAPWTLLSSDFSNLSDAPENRWKVDKI